MRDIDICIVSLTEPGCRCFPSESAWAYQTALHGNRASSDSGCADAHENKQVALIAARNAEAVVQKGRLQHATCRCRRRDLQPADAEFFELNIDCPAIIAWRELSLDGVLEQTTKYPLLILRSELRGADRLEDAGAIGSEWP